MSIPTEYYLDENGLVLVLTALKNALVEKETGKGLSTNDYTTAEKTKLAGIEAGAEVNVQSDWNQTDTSADDYIKNKPSAYSLPIASASTLGGIKVGSNLSIDSSGVLSASGGGDEEIHILHEGDTGYLAEMEGLYLVEPGSSASSAIAYIKTSSTDNASVLNVYSGTIINVGETYNDNYKRVVAWGHNISKQTGNGGQGFFYTGAYGVQTNLMTAENLVGYVVDNLTSVSSFSPLSAYQGKVLNEGKLAVANLLQGNNITLTTAGSGANQTVTVSATIPSEYITETELSGYGYQTASQVTSAITSYGYQTASDVTTAINAAIASAYIYKGSVASYANLPSSGNTTGDVYNVEDTGMNYAWTGTAWDALGMIIDTSIFLTANDIQPLSSNDIQDALTAAGF